MPVDGLIQYIIALPEKPKAWIISWMVTSIFCLNLKSFFAAEFNLPILYVINPKLGLYVVCSIAQKAPVAITVEVGLLE